MASKALDLFQAYSENKLPKDGGYIVSSFFSNISAYSIYEVVAYSGVKNLYLSSEGLSFQTDGNKVYILVEPVNYSKKYIEPVSRDRKDQIPHRFSELDIYTAKDQSKIMISKEPIMTFSSFTILKPTGINFALCFYNLPDVLDTLSFFFNQTLNKEAGISKGDSKTATNLVIRNIKRFTLWK